MSINVRKLFGQRLQADLTRKGIDRSTLSKKSGLSQSIISDYLKSTRELSIDEIQKICNVLGLNPFRVFAQEMPEVSLIYRGANDKALIQREDSLNFVLELCAEPVRQYQRTIADCDGEPTMLLVEIMSHVEEIKSELGDGVENIYNAINLPVILLPDVGKYEAFIVKQKPKKAMVCINRKYLNQPARLHFSLLHELAHFIFGHESGVELLEEDSGFSYDKTIPPEKINEFIANKFAQEFLFGFREAEQFSSTSGDITRTVAEKGTSIHVVANALYDVEKRKSTNTLTKSYNEILNELGHQNHANSQSSRAEEIVAFVRDEHNKTKDLIQRNRGTFSETVLRKICDDLELALE